jgi:RNA polymerase sigma-70 factor (ECF subfamily)
MMKGTRRSVSGNRERRMAEQREPEPDPEQRRSEQLARLFERFRRPLLRYLTDLLTRREEAEDVVQETYVRLMQVEQLENGRVRALIFKVATNLAYDRFRQRRARGAHADDTALAEIQSAEPAPERIVAFEQALAIVKRTLLELKPRCRQVFLLRTAEDLTYDEIAARLRVSKRTVEREMQHALEVCQRRLSGIDGNG